MNLTATDANPYILSNTPKPWQKMMQTNYSYGIETDPETLDKNDEDPTKWSNPLESRLPNAPSMKIYCIYGVGKPTERAYYYTEGPKIHEGIQSDQQVGVCESDDCINTEESNEDLPLTAQNAIDLELHLPNERPQVLNGVKFGEGDGTVSLISLGSMCSTGWRRDDKRYNPGNSRIVSYEIKHEPDPLDLRGGDNTGDHVDILGSTPLNEVILKIASGNGHLVKDNFVSDIREISDRINWVLKN